jgi:hypothetical protein
MRLCRNGFSRQRLTKTSEKTAPDMKKVDRPCAGLAMREVTTMTTMTLMTRQQAAEMLGASTMMLIRLERSGELTPIKLTKKPTAMTRYEIREVEALIERRRSQFKQARKNDNDDARHPRSIERVRPVPAPE